MVGLKVALYARRTRPPAGWKASIEGEEPPGSIPVQLNALRVWAAREGHEVVLEASDVATGKNPNRPNWDRVVAEARGHHINAVAVTKSDRVMRSILHYHQLVNEFLSLGVDLIFVEQGQRIAKTDATSKLLCNILADLAVWELDLIRERSAAVMERRADGRLYGPRSDKPAGRPREYREEDGHRFRVRSGHRVHDKGKCKVCKRGEMEVEKS